ncbi:MAG: hypothetical protein NVV74_25590 [Magnetospirillum sp.]|nr:hypothetical protein [Magnetospirillum sp.]
MHTRAFGYVGVAIQRDGSNAASMQMPVADTFCTFNTGRAMAFDEGAWALGLTTMVLESSGSLSVVAINAFSSSRG